MTPDSRTPATAESRGGAAVGGPDGPTGESRDRFGPPLTARSVVASVLLGTVPPVMSVRALVRAGELFGLAEGTVRTALSRMTAAGELVREDSGRYALAGHLIQRQAHQQLSRQPDLGVWNGSWQMWVVELGSRAPSDRAALRSAARSLRLAEMRDGVWLRPDNLRSSIESVSQHTMTLASQARRFVTHPDRDDELAAELWDLERWDSESLELRRAMHGLREPLARCEPAALREGFVLAAAVLRQFNADPLLPPELLRGAHQGDALRRDFDDYDSRFRTSLRRWLTP